MASPDLAVDRIMLALLEAGLTTDAQDATLLAEARGWLADCGLECATDELGEAEVLLAVELAYDGGLAGFLDAIAPLLHD